MSEERMEQLGVPRRTFLKKAAAAAFVAPVVVTFALDGVAEAHSRRSYPNQALANQTEPNQALANQTEPVESCNPKQSVPNQTISIDPPASEPGFHFPRRRR
jgi:hypothetical protein